MPQVNNNNFNKAKAALYCRVSSEEQKQGKTINSQIKELEDFAKANSYEIAERYIDEGWSGAVLERPALDRLRDKATKGIFGAVLVNDVDRLSREMLHLGIIKRDLERKGIKLVFRSLPNTGDPLSNFMINVLGSFAEFERQMIADRIRRGKRYKVEVRNLILGNIPPYGYDYVPKIKGSEGFYKINKKEAKIVRLMYDWVAKEGLSQRAVVRKLMVQGIPSRNGAIWSKSSTQKVLTNPTYIGITYWNKHRAIEIENRRVRYTRSKTSRLRPKEEWIPIKLPDHLKIIDEKTFYAVQSQLQRNRCYAKRNNTVNFYLLKGLVRCGLCASRYTGAPCHGKLYYRCGNRIKMFPRPRECTAGSIKASKLDGVVWGAVVNAIQNPKVITEQVINFEEKQKRYPTETEQSIKEIKEESRKLEKEEGRLFDAYRKEIIELMQFKREMDKINGERNRLGLELKESENREVPQVPKKQVVRSIKEYCRIFKNKLARFTPEQKQAFLRLLVEEIKIKDGRVRISAVLPAYNDSQENESMRPDNLLENLTSIPPCGNIVPTLIDGYGHNTTFRFELEAKI